MALLLPLLLVRQEEGAVIKEEEQWQPRCCTQAAWLGAWGIVGGGPRGEVRLGKPRERRSKHEYAHQD